MCTDATPKTSTKTCKCAPNQCRIAENAARKSMVIPESGDVETRAQ